MRLYDYISDEDRDMEICESLVEHQLRSLDFELNELMLERETNMLQIETKVLLENGTDEDLAQLYIVEAKEAEKTLGFYPEYAMPCWVYSKGLKNGFSVRK